MPRRRYRYLIEAAEAAKPVTALLHLQIAEMIQRKIALEELMNGAVFPLSNLGNISFFP